jgi:hypothetical protein
VAGSALRALAVVAALAVALPVAAQAQSLRISTTSIHFAAAPPNMDSTPSYVYLTNNGAVAVTIGTPQIASGPFTVTNGCPATLEPYHSCTLTLYFAPTELGSFTGTLQIFDNAPGSPQSVALSGRCSPAGVYLSNTTWNFGPTAPGVQSGPGEMYVTNSSPAKSPLTIYSIDIIGPNASSFSLTNQCPMSPATLGGGLTCDLLLYFDPTQTGVLTATVQLTDDAPDSPQTISLQGFATGPSVLLSTSNWSFAPTPIGTVGQGTLYVTNNGNEPLNFNSISTSGQYFNVASQSCGASLAAYTTCWVTVAFAPTTAGVWTGTLNFSDDALPAMQSVTLSGWAEPVTSSAAKP